MSEIPIDGYAMVDSKLQEPFVFVRRVEGLLREAELRGIKWAEGRDIVQTQARIAELAKGRA